MEKNRDKSLHYYFAPLEGITNYTFRQTHHRFFPGCEKGMKKIRKARRREQYLDGVREIVQNCPFEP